MKKTMLIMMISAGFLFAGHLNAQSVTGNSESPEKSSKVEKQQTPAQNGPNFTDKNGDGICDNRAGSGKRKSNFIDQNNDGICDHFANRSGKGNGRNFVDANNDGVCDHFAEGRKGRGGCNGQGFRHRNGQK